MEYLTKALLWPFANANQATVAGVGFYLGLVGFGLTWLGLWLARLQIKKTATSVQAASDAISAVQLRVAHFDSVFEASKAAQHLDHAIEQIGQNEWKTASQSYEQVRRCLVRIRQGSTNLDEDTLSSMQACAKQISSLCKKVDVATMTDNSNFPNPSATLELARNHHDLISSITISLQKDAMK